MQIFTLSKSIKHRLLLCLSSNNPRRSVADIGTQAPVTRRSYHAVTEIKLKLGTIALIMILLRQILIIKISRAEPAGNCTMRQQMTLRPSILAPAVLSTPALQIRTQQLRHTPVILQAAHEQVRRITLESESTGSLFFI